MDSSVTLVVSFKGRPKSPNSRRCTKHPSVKEAIAYLWGNAVSGRLNTAVSVSISPTKDE